MTDTPALDLLTLDEFVRFYETEGPFEIINGERRAIVPPVALHGLTTRAFFKFLEGFCSAHDLGQVFFEMAFVLIYDSNWVKGSRVPDVMFIAAERWGQYTAEVSDCVDKPIVLVPDLVVKVVSPNDLYTDIQDKVALYINDGVKLVWVADPKRQRVTVYSAQHYQLLGVDDTLDAGAVIPGFSVRPSEVFAGR